MTPLQRLKQTIEKKGDKTPGNPPVDRPPLICPGGMMTMVVKEAMEAINIFWPAAHDDADLMAGLTLGMAELGGIENLGVPFCMTVEAEGMGGGAGRHRKPGRPLLHDR